MNEPFRQTDQEQTAAASDRSAMSSNRPHRWRRLILRVLLAVVIFFSGGVVGVGVALIAVRQGIVYGIHHPKEMTHRVARKMQRRLDLSDQQTRQVEQILVQRQLALQQIRRHYQPEVEHQLDLLEQQVSEVLNPEQRRRWQKTIRDMRATWLPKLPD